MLNVLCVVRSLWLPQDRTFRFSFILGVVYGFRFYGFISGAFPFDVLPVRYPLVPSPFCKSAFLIGTKSVRFRSYLQSHFLWVPVPTSHEFSKPLSAA